MFGPDEDGAITEPPAKTSEMMYDSDKTVSIPNLLLKLKLKLKLKITPKILLKLNPLNLKLKLKIVSTPELSMNVKNVMQNLAIK